MKSVVALLLSLVVGPLSAESPQGYYRFPAISGDTIVFSAEGDLWTVPLSGGVARRLTTHPGEESHPHVSPDGQTVAFTATYEGPSELYTMPLAGGLPVRRTWEADDSTAVGWTPDGRLLYTTRAFSTLPDPQLVAIDLNDGSFERIPLSQASDGDYDGSGNTLYFIRPGFHRNNTKRYQGGTARNVWRFTSGQGEASNLTADHPGENHSPMWWKGRVYYICDRDGMMNIWSMNERGRDHRQHTRHSEWDVRSADLDQGRIVYRLGADLRLFEIGNGRDRVVSITLASDLDQLREKWVTDPDNYVTSAAIHPEGESIVLTARGRLFVAPAEQGRLVQVSRKPGTRFRDGVFMPDGSRILALSDESGELEFHALPADGVGSSRALTNDGTILRWKGLPSPDSSHIAFSDKNEDLWILEMESGRQTKISSDREGIGGFAWSPDSRWLAYVKAAGNTYLQIHLYGLGSGQSHVVTSDRVNSHSPAWSPDGRFLYFLSDRSLVSTVGSPWGWRQPEPFFDKPWKVYVLALQKGRCTPFMPHEEVGPCSKEEPKKAEGEDPSPVTIDLEGLAARVKQVPIEPGNYRSLVVNDKALFLTGAESGRNAPRHLYSLPINRKGDKPVKIFEDIGRGGFELSANGKKLLVRKGNSFYVFDASSKKPNLKTSRVDLSSWSFPIDVREDFRQIFIDAWRLERDYFYDPGTHGVDWEAVRDKYLPLVERVTNRMELSDLIGELVSELSALHVSVRGGDHREGPDQVQVATLGARLKKDTPAGGYRVDYIYRSDPDYPDELSPLADPYLEIEAGDLIEAINGVPVLSVAHPYALLRNQHNKPVRFTVRDAGASQSREVMVTPILGERALRYRDWELTRRLAVEEKSQGQIGYVHLQAMGGRNLTEWYRNFYPVFNRAGLIVDVRHNRGGNIDSIILEKLMRKAWFYWKDRVGQPTWNMQYAFRGHMVVLCDEVTASDGEAFAEGFRRLGLGPVIGTRTWGGEIWLSNNNRLTDGGLARAPQTGVYGPEGEWLIEGHGVDPDIEVDNPPHATFNGQDAQLETAIDYLLDKIRKDPVDVPQPPPYPDKSFPRRARPEIPPRNP